MKCIRPFTFHMPFAFWSTDSHACKMIGAAFKARRGSWAKNPQMQSNSWRFEPQNWLQLQICLLNNRQLLSAYHTCYLFPGSFKSCLQVFKPRNSGKLLDLTKFPSLRRRPVQQNWRLWGVISQQHLLLSCCANTRRISRFFMAKCFVNNALGTGYFSLGNETGKIPLPLQKEGKGCQQKCSIST